jgi:hypothetical protein
MELTPPDPDRQAWIAKLRAQIERDRPRDPGRPPFTVLGLSEPVLTPALLAEWHLHNGELAEVELVFGASLSATGPFVSVRSQAPASLPEPLEDLIADERTRLSEMAGIDDPPPGREQTGAELLRVNGRRRPVELRREGSVWAAALPAARGTWVSVVGRGVDVATVALASVTDLERFPTAGAGLLAELAAATPEPAASPREWDLPAATSVQAHETLAAATLADLEAFRASGDLRRRLPRGLTTGVMWEAATRAQMALAGQGREAATDAVTSMVNHLTALRDEPWFAEPPLRAAAVAETVGWTAFGVPVRSEPAQRAWAVLWSARSGRPLTDPIAEAMVGPREWSAAWRAWAGR